MWWSGAGTSRRVSAAGGDAGEREPRIEEINAYIGRDRNLYGAEPICRAFAGRSVTLQALRRTVPQSQLRSKRAQRDDLLMLQTQRGWEQCFLKGARHGKPVLTNGHPASQRTLV